MKKVRGTYRLVAAGLLAMVAALTVFVVLGGHKDVPDRDIPTPAPAFAADTMYVAPGDTGEENGGEDNAEDDSDVQSENVTQDQQESNEEPDKTDNARKGGGNGQAGRAPGGNGDPKDPGNPSNPSNPNNPTNPKKKDDPTPGPEMPGIFTNLGNYRSINANTPAPNKVAITLDGKSGLSRTDRLLYFYAVPSEAKSGYSVLVEYANSSTGGHKSALMGSGGLYGLPVVLSDGAHTDVTLTLVDSKGNRTNRTAT